MERAEQASDAISSLVQDIDNNVAAAHQISDVSGEQMSRLETLRSQLDTLLDTLSENSLKVHTTGAISLDLYRVTENLRDIMKQFQFDPNWTAKPADNESRRVPRVSKNMLVQVREGERLRDAITVDFSMTGLQLRTPLPLADAKVGSLLKLQMQLPHDSIEQYTRQDPLEIQAKLLWERAGKEGQLYGMEFSRPSPEQQERLRQCFAFYSQSPSYR
ncbi:PilZ domain-containing protein [Chromobacterium sp. IIBBL 290-4]|uniref:PilZ domain-containing protein n=1 Tax=Chromobacterium sp. IIBBL 290-4 TaxID=2953890 RepID=UPI0020B6F4C6|nr:PilZ domain-containing protein [Chromobacterium sp. IIBBL 290-4]UTH73803.1 PilZ domain-containing protein [Chromobacterium sp. IIBBL 290-4]